MPKAQFKKGLVYEKLGEVDIAVEEYVKLAYKYPDRELIPSVMSRLGSYFQRRARPTKTAESLEKDEDNVEAQGEAIKLREKMVTEYRTRLRCSRNFRTDSRAIHWPGWWVCVRLRTICGPVTIRMRSMASRSSLTRSSTTTR